ncbi:MAG TPA: hypothetical protein DEA08_10480 [Planctomycetes bacterium]|nr:hypothetical protein [Planctomycetota bacterium]
MVPPGYAGRVSEPPAKRRVTLQAQQTCPLCREPAGDEALTVCPRCETLYHAECVRDLAGGRCATPGCAKPRQEGSVSARDPLAGISAEPLPSGGYELHLLHRLRRSGDALHLEPDLDLTIVLVLGGGSLALGAGFVAFDAPFGLLLLPGMVFAMSLLGLWRTRQRGEEDLRVYLDRPADRLEARGGKGQPLRTTCSAVAAVQFNLGNTYTYLEDGERREAQALQLGLVLASGERHLLLEAMEQDGLYRFAHELAEYLEVPLLDSTEDE